MRVSLLSHVLIIAGSIIIFHLYGASSYYIRRASPNRNITPRRSMYSHQNEYVQNDYYQDRPADRPYYTGSSSNYFPYNYNNMPGYNQGYNQQYWNSPYANNFYPGNFMPWAPPTIVIIKAESCLPPEQNERPASSHSTTEEADEENEEPMIPTSSAVVPESATPVQNSTGPGSQLNVSSSTIEENSIARKRSALNNNNPQPSKITRAQLTQIARAAAVLSRPQRRAMQFSFVDGKLSLNNADESDGRASSYVVVDLGRHLKEEN